MNEQNRKLGPYIIEREAGRGGMGVVYLARDPRLDRAVAIKVLPDEVAQDPDRLARFEREARLLASLNHPNIAGIYGIEEADGTRFLSLEYIDGPTLAERLQSGPMPVDEAMEVCVQIAAALEAAHENGVIHRDLKPANVKLTPDGVVKVLDFGLAKDVTGTADSASGLSNSPTISAHATTPGVILGTAAYMSPEQARGKPMDRRTDIFSFGCVLYECLTGRQLFAGETVSDTIAKILEREPDWSILPGSTPRKVREVLRRCLEKDAKKRQRDIGDARLAFEEVDEARTSSMLAAQESGVHGKAAARQNRSLMAAWGTAIVAAVVAIVSLGTSNLFKNEPSEPPVRFVVAPPSGVTMVSAAQTILVSPDGQSLLYAGRDSAGSGLWIREMDSLEARPLPQTQNATLPFWSPDGESIAFIDGSKLRRMSIHGGDPQIICDATSTRGGSWGSEFIVFAGEQGPLHRVPIGGGTPEPVTTLDAARGETAHRFPHFLPDGKTFLYVTLPSKSGRVSVFASDVEGREPVEILSAVSSPVYAPPGYLLFQLGRRLMAQRFNAKSLQLSGESVVIGDAPRRPQAVGAPALSASRDGRIAFLNVGDLDTRMAWLDRNGRVLEELDLEAGNYRYQAVSPDGRFVAMTKELSPEEEDIWVLELERMVMTRFTSGPGKSADPIWSPDGKYIAYSTDAEGPWKIYRKPFPGGGDAEPVAIGGATFKNPLHWSPDGKHLLYEQIGTGTNMDLWIAPIGGDEEPRMYLADTFQEDQARFSPDGKWIVYKSDETGESSLYLNSFPIPGKKHRVIPGRGFFPLWSVDGSEIFYTSGDGQWIMRVPVQTDPEFRAGTPERMFRRNRERFTVAPDGQRLLRTGAVSAATPTAAVVVLNWTSSLPE